MADAPLGIDPRAAWTGDSVVMMFDAKPHRPGTPAFLRLYVEDCDATYQQALDAGGSSVTRPTDMPWGDRISRVSDPLGNLWWIMQRTEEVSPEEEARRYGEALRRAATASRNTSRPWITSRVPNSSRRPTREICEVLWPARAKVTDLGCNCFPERMNEAFTSPQGVDFRALCTFRVCGKRNT